MTDQPVTDQSVTVTIEVDADPRLAFEIFTAQIDTWWLRGPKHRFRAPWNGRLLVLPGPSGRLLEQYADGTSFEIGRVLRWAVGEQIVLSWRLPSFRDTEATEVDVRFTAIDGGTRVSVQHRGWSKLRSDHPARHGKTGSEYEYMKAGLWADNLAALQTFLARRRMALADELTNCRTGPAHKEK